MCSVSVFAHISWLSHWSYLLSQSLFIHYFLFLWIHIYCLSHFSYLRSWYMVQLAACFSVDTYNISYLVSTFFLRFCFFWLRPSSLFALAISVALLGRCLSHCSYLPYLYASSVNLVFTAAVNHRIHCFSLCCLSQCSHMLHHSQLLFTASVNGRMCCIKSMLSVTVSQSPD